MDIVIPLTVLFLGCGASLHLARSKWPGWMGLPFLVLVGSVVLHAGITPLATQFLGAPPRGFRGVPRPEEMPNATALIILNALAIGVGMILAWWFWGRDHSTSESAADTAYSPSTLSRAWKASSVMFLFGAFCNAIVLGLLISEYSLLQLSSTRALFTSEVAVSGGLISYAKQFRATMDIGAWGMLLFSAKRQDRTRLAFIANFLVICLNVVYGGRLRTITAAVAFVLLYHYGVERIRLSVLVRGAVATLPGLAFIQLARLGARSPTEALFGVARDFLVTRSIADTAFALRTFPNPIPFQGWGGVVGPLSHFFPTLHDHIPIGSSVWMFLVDHMYGGQNPVPGGGSHFIPAAEHYIQFGRSGVIFLGLALGLLYGCLFAWQKRQPRNLFLLVFGIYVSKAFLGSIMDGEMVPWIGGFGFGVVLPVGVLAAVTYGRRGSELTLFGPLYLCALSFFLRRLIDAEIFDYTFAIALIPAYVKSLQFIGKASPANDWANHVRQSLAARRAKPNYNGLEAH